MSHPPDHRRHDAVDDRHRRPEQQRKCLFAWSFPPITETNEQPLVFPHDNPYALKFLEFGEIGLKLLGHSQDWKAM